MDANTAVCPYHPTSSCPCAALVLLVLLSTTCHRWSLQRGPCSSSSTSSCMAGAGLPTAAPGPGGSVSVHGS